MANKNNWSLELDLSDVNLDSRAVAPEGWYQGKIVDTFSDDQHPNRINFHVQITEGEFTGLICRDSMMKPGTYEGKDNRYFWAQLLLSVGTPIANVKNNSRLPIPDGQGLIGLDTYIWFKPGSVDDGTWSRMRFHAKDRWEYEKKKFEAAGSAMSGTAAPSVIPSVTPAVIPAPTQAIPAAIPSPVPSNGGGIPSPTSGYAPPGSGGDDILALLKPSN